MFSLVMFKNSSKTINISNKNTQKINRVLSRNKDRMHNMGILGGGLFSYKMSPPVKPNNLLENKRQNRITKQNDKIKKSGEYQKLSDSLLYYHIKSNKKGNIVYITTNKGVYLSSDYGNNWSLTSAPKKNIRYYTLFVSNTGKHVIVGCREGRFLLQKVVIYYSYNYGYSWEKSSFPIQKADNIRSIIEFKNSIYLLTEKGKLFKSENIGSTWENIKNLKGDYFNSLTCSNTNLFLISKIQNKYFIKTSFTRGQFWQSFKEIKRGYSLKVSKNKQNFIYINYVDGIYNIFVSKSYGKSWKKTLTLKNRIYIVCDENCKNVICVSIKNKCLYVSDNYGMTWKKQKPANFNYNLCLLNHDNSFRLTL